MRTDYVITVIYAKYAWSGPKPLVYDYRSAWSLRRVEAFARKQFKHAYRVEVVVKPKS